MLSHTNVCSTSLHVSVRHTVEPYPIPSGRPRLPPLTSYYTASRLVTICKARSLSEGSRLALPSTSPAPRAPFHGPAPIRGDEALQALQRRDLSARSPRRRHRTAARRGRRRRGAARPCERLSVRSPAAISLCRPVAFALCGVVAESVRRFGGGCTPSVQRKSKDVVARDDDDAVMSWASSASRVVTFSVKR